MFFSLKFKSRLFVKGKISFKSLFFFLSKPRSLIHTFSFAGFNTLVESCEGELSVMFSHSRPVCETRCGVAPIPTTAAAEVAVWHSRACLQDFHGSVGPSMGTSGSNLSHTHHTVFLYKLSLTLAYTCGDAHCMNLHACDQHKTHTQPQRGTVAITSDPHPT